MEHARVWSEANPQEFGAVRSIETVHGTLGWRMGGPSLRTLPGWTWDQVKENLKAVSAMGYIRVKEEVNKQNLLADRETISAEKLRELGVRVVQEESFFVEPKLNRDRRQFAVVVFRPFIATVRPKPSRYQQLFCRAQPLRTHRRRRARSSRWSKE